MNWYQWRNDEKFDLFGEWSWKEVWRQVVDDQSAEKGTQTKLGPILQNWLTPFQGLCSKHGQIGAIIRWMLLYTYLCIIKQTHVNFFSKVGIKILLHNFIYFLLLIVFMVL